jgi:hypothetical protein
MKTIFKVVIFFLFAALFVFPKTAVLASAATDLQGQEIKKILSSPSKGANVNFEIPVEVRILDVTDDLNWYKVKIGFDFLGHHEYEGWTYIPLGNYIREKEAQMPPIKEKLVPTPTKTELGTVEINVSATSEAQ